MKLHRILLWALVLFLSATPFHPVPAVASSVAHFDVHQISPPDTVSEALVENLSGGRRHAFGEAYRLCVRSNLKDVRPDYVTGCWYLHAERMIYPDGSQEVWGTSVLQDLPAFPLNEGGWDAEFTGEWLPGFPAVIVSLTMTARGTGALEGWTLVTTTTDAAHAPRLPRQSRP